MDINQQLLELHISFRANQELNGGDRAEEILGLISRLFDSTLTSHSAPSMDLSLKQEMSKIVCKDDEKYNDHGFEISNEIRPTFELFKRFLKENNAEEYWSHLKDGGSSAPFNNSCDTWIDKAFYWAKAPEGWSFWVDLDKKWRSSLVQLKEIKTQEFLKHDNHGFDIPEELQPIFDKFKQFLKDNDAEAYWDNNKRSSRFFKDHYKNKWIEVSFDFLAFDTIGSSFFWNELNLSWQEQLK
jgi:hypothetical protein